MYNGNNSCKNLEQTNKKPNRFTLNKNETRKKKITINIPIVEYFTTSRKKEKEKQQPKLGPTYL